MSNSTDATPRVYLLAQPKGGSQWVRNMLSDSESRPFVPIKEFLDTQDFDPTRIAEYGPFLAGPLYNKKKEEMEDLLRPTDKIVMLIRDPRDVMVSFYHSVAYSHGQWTRWNQVFKEYLLMLDPIDQLRVSIIRENHAFKWWNTWDNDPRVLRVRYEDFLADARGTLQKVYDFLAWSVPENVRDSIVHKYSFETSSGRNRGEENVFSHLRKGVAGGWKEHFDRLSGSLLEAVFPGQLLKFKYEDNPDWYMDLPEKIESKPKPATDLDTVELLRTNNLLSEQVKYLEKCCQERLDLIETLSKAAQERLELVNKLHEANGKNLQIIQDLEAKLNNR